jgi:ParB/RepB/Spo0J family partition protein
MSTTPVEKTDIAPMPQTIPATTREVSLDQIEPSPWNRKRFNPKALEELAGSIVNTDGVVQAVVLRPMKAPHKPYQLVAGERRWLASKIAREKLGFQRATITATVREMTDAQALEITLIENGQREDVPVLELCRAYKALMGQTDSDTGKPYTRELIAERTKKSYSLVCAILNSDQAIPEVQEAAARGKLSDSLVLEIAKYTPAEQKEAFTYCFGHQYRNLKEIEKDKNAESQISVRKFREWAAQHIHIELKAAPFDVKDEFLLKGVTSCVKCPKRTGSNPGLFAEANEMKKGDVCTDPSCFDAKKEAFIQIRIAEEQRQAAPAATVHVPAKATASLPAGVKPLGAGFSTTAAGASPKKALPTPPPIPIQKISSLCEWQVRANKQKDVLYEGDYTLAKPGCKKEKKAIWVDGPKIGQATFICDVANCGNHGYSSSGGGGSSHAPVTFERKLEIWNSRVQLVYRDSLAKGIVEAKPRELREQEARIVCDYVLRKMDYRDGRKICRVYGLKETSNGFSSMNHGLERFAKGLKGDELLRFIVICAMEGELGLEDQYYGGALKPADPLAIVAADYKVDQAKLLTDAKAALEKKRPKSKAEKEKSESKKAKPAGDVKPAPNVKKKSKPGKSAKTKKKK